LDFSDALRHVPTHWLPLFPALDRRLQNSPAVKCYSLEQGDNAQAIILQFIQEQENELNDYTSSLTLPEYYLHFPHNIMLLFHTFVLKLEGNSIAVTEILESIKNIYQFCSKLISRLVLK
jgi:hypothetical protein